MLGEARRDVGVVVLDPVRGGTGASRRARSPIGSSDSRCEIVGDDRRLDRQETRRLLDDLLEEPERLRVVEVTDVG